MPPLDTADAGDRDHWFEDAADFLGSAYLRYSFTKGTAVEVDAIVDRLGLQPGDRILDVGCGPGRHSHELARRGFLVHGIDISERFIELAQTGAPAGATFERVDARSVRFDEPFDAVICLCQGGFGMMLHDADDRSVLTTIAAALRPGTGRLAISAFNAYFVVLHHDEADFDPSTGTSHERTEIRNADGERREIDLWTGCFTPREMRLLLAEVGLVVDDMWGVEPGCYQPAQPSVDLPELLTFASKPDRVEGSPA